MLKPHTGQRKRPIRAAEVEAFKRRRAGSQKERQVAMRLYEPFGGRIVKVCDGCEYLACKVNGICILQGCATVDPNA